jgi:hypothetical protein
MKIQGDNRTICHVVEGEDKPVTTIIFDAKMNLEKRYETFKYVADEIKKAWDLEKIAAEKAEKEAPVVEAKVKKEKK